MKRRRLVLPLLLAACAPAPRSPSPSADTPVAFTQVNVVPMDRDTVLRGQTVLVHGGRILAIGTRVRMPAETRMVDGRGKYLVPGLWDMHVHTLPRGNREMESFIPLFLAHGVTGVRDMGGFTDSLAAARRLIAGGGVPAPRLVASGPLLDGARQQWSHAIAWHLATPQEAVRAVDSLQRADVDFIKVYGLLPRDAYFAVAAEATRRGLPFAGHLPREVAATEAARAGQASLEHEVLALLGECIPDGRERLRQNLAAWTRGGFAAKFAGRREIRASRDEAACARVFATLRLHGTWLVPTMVNEIKDAARVRWPALEFMAPRLREGCRGTIESIQAADDTLRAAYFRDFLDDVRDAHRAGVGLLAGSDVPNPCMVPGASLHDELALFVEAGLTPYEALRTATVNPARYFGATDSLGMVEIGKAADLVLLDANPLHDINAVRRISGVMVRGAYLDRAALDGLLRDAKAAHGPTP